MKATSNCLYLCVIVASITFINCNKTHFPPEIELDHNIELGATRVYLNGKFEPGYSAEFQFVELYSTLGQNNTLLFHFQDKPEEWLWNALSFSGINVSVGKYNILGTGTIAGPPNTTFTQTYQEDLIGYSYKLINQQDAYFDIESLDTIKQEVKGSFKAIFERTSKNGHSDLRLPKILLFQGVFYEKYEHL